ncbi:tetratricopeptide repeat protein [Bradyrhizobium yuanmingense]|uniref:tetratricopeptide repeat protein n=1 Tax=Bradyrhizobium yuanmingense TaxID=108015 RepID=UPI0023B8D274|nr:tetratricopeptide repeat protein [Bradyrhizobium yuanmingense]MDF0585068.1 tetratricopeptide repeat protein [Bradyrhizobium yuanmingense]
MALAGDTNAGDAGVEEAVDALRAGRLEEAESACRSILEAFPGHHGCLNVLGIVAFLRGQVAPARDFLQRAVALAPGNASYRVNLAKALHSLGALDEAERHFREAIRLGCDEVDSRLGLANLLRTVGRLEEALDCLSEVVRLRPDDADVRGIHANLLHDLGRIDDAELHYHEACRLKPEFPEVLNNLGNLCQARGRLQEAEMYFRRALSCRPEFPETCNNLGNLLRELGRPEEAESYCREALRLRPDYPIAHNNLGNALKERGIYEAAEFHYREAIRLKPHYAEVYNNLGSLFGDLAELEKAEDFYRRAIELRPGYSEALANLGMTLLGAGKFEEGWRTYDPHRKIERRDDLTGAQWIGDDLDGRTLLIYAEQGFGDVLQFSRFVPLAGARGRIVFEVPRPLLGLLAQMPGVDQIVARGDKLPHYDVRCALMSLPRWLGIAFDHIRGDAPYLAADRNLVAKWRNRVEALPGLRVGLAWAGNPALANDRCRSMALQTLAELGDVTGVSFVSLQKGEASAQTSSTPPGFRVHDWSAELSDFADTAALISALDLVITVDTSIVHLTGALGRPVWLLNRFNSCWRWLFDSTRSPWYVTLRQFKQQTPGDWDAVVANVKAALAGQSANAVSPGTFEEGLRHHQAGRLDRAETIYRRILNKNPDHAGSLHMIGVIHFQRREYARAIDYIGRAIELEPRDSNFRHNFANALGGLGRRAEAEAEYRAAIRLNENHGDAHGALGMLLLEAGRLDAAEPHLRKACDLRPSSEIARNDLGILLCRRDALDDAEAKFREALQIKFDFAQAHANLGSILRARGELDRAAEHCRLALASDENLAEAHFVLAQVLEGLDRYEEAERAYRKAIALKPDNADWYNDLAKLLVDLRRLDEAWPLFDQTLRIRPDHPEAHSNRAIARLLTGDHVEGWTEYEWRWKLKKRPGRLDDFPQPVWNGEDISGRTLLIHAEQGFGDTIQFCRLVPLLRSGARVVLEVQRALAPLLKDLPGVNQLVPRGDPLPQFDVHCPLLSLSRLLGLSLTDVPGRVPYLVPDAGRVEMWRRRLRAVGGFRVGLAWAGSPTMADDRRRSIPPDGLAELAGIRGVSFVSLQRSAPGQAIAAPSGLMLHDFTHELNDFADTAALIANLDLTISVDTAVIHVAGALGRPVWLLNRFNGCWRWLLHRNDCPWYPTLRQFRQPTPGDWGSVVGEVAQALESTHRPLETATMSAAE